jgi:hypothetical protein
MKFILLALLSLPAFAQIGRPYPPYPHPYPFPDPFPQDFCDSWDVDQVTRQTRQNCQAKAQSWGAEKGVDCRLTRVRMDSCEAMCDNAAGERFARLRMQLRTTCGRWGNTSRLYNTKILYYR